MHAIYQVWFILLFIGPSITHASTFTPFGFLDPNLTRRPDIASVSGELKTDLPSLNPIRSAEVSGVKLFLFRELTEIYEAVATRTPRQSSFTFEVSSPPNCVALGGFDLSYLPAASNDRSCKSDQALVATAFQGLPALCNSVVRPELSFKGHDVSKISLYNFYDLNFLIRHVGEPFFHFQLPIGMAAVDLLPRLRVILAKMQYADLYQSVSDRINLLQQSGQILRTRPQCFQDSARVVQLRNILGGLFTDLNLLRSYLLTLDRKGRAQAKQDREIVSAIGRAREVLPYPSLTDNEREFLSLYLGALYWRARGGGLFDEPQGTQLTRIYFTLATMSTIAFLNGGEKARPAGEALFFRLFQPWSEWQDMGRSTGDDKFHDLAYMTKRGLYQVGAEVAELYNRGFDVSYATAGGLMMGPCYYYGWEKVGSLHVAPDLTPPYREFINDGINWGELCTGGAISLGLAKSLLQGYDPRWEESHRN